eukprot:8147365-Pyramimonas_sp.AAC.1
MELLILLRTSSHKFAIVGSPSLFKSAFVRCMLSMNPRALSTRYSVTLFVGTDTGLNISVSLSAITSVVAKISAGG